MAKKKTNATHAPEPVIEAAARAAAELTELGARFALVGGLAVSAWCEPRFTRDVDLAVAVERDDDASMPLCWPLQKTTGAQLLTK